MEGQWAMREVITREKLKKLVEGKNEVLLPMGTILTKAARDWAKEKGIKLDFVGSKDAPSPVDDVEKKGVERAIVTVIGRDRVGIIAAVAGVLAGANVNILDISQTVLQGFFAMIMIVDLSQATVDFATLKKMLEEKGEELELNITLQHEDVFRYMHRI